ncbi:MAG: response regulator, partial [Proteobacteria bacterium]|nr:response regulator [Pseudomonadota bacterium]
MEAVGTLAGGIAHDFNNVLQAISGYVQLLLMRKGADDPDHNYLTQIDRSIKRAAELVQQLLIFSRKAETRLRPVDLNLEVAQVHKLLIKTIPRMVNVELRLADNIRIINADSMQLEQIVMNLAVNASDAMPDGGRLIIETKNTVLDEEYCKTYLGATPGEYVLLTVSDTGCGMDRETLKHIFEPFYTTKEPGKGTGLGLAIIYGIVKSHNGHITCYSEPGSGATFKIYFPVLETEDIQQAPEREEMEEIHGGSETILLVDDEKSIIDIGRDILGQYGYTIITAESGEEAVEVYKREGDRIDLVVLDLGMPGMGGHKCMEELLGINPEAKVIIASGYSPSGKAQDTLKAGAAGFIGKPYQLASMLKKVREVLD